MRGNVRAVERSMERHRGACVGPHALAWSWEPGRPRSLSVCASGCGFWARLPAFKAGPRWYLCYSLYFCMPVQTIVAGLCSKPRVRVPGVHWTCSHGW